MIAVWALLRGRKGTRIFFYLVKFLELEILSLGLQRTMFYLGHPQSLGSLFIVPSPVNEARPRAGFFQGMPHSRRGAGSLIGNILKSTAKTNALFNFSVLEVLSILLITVVNSGF